MSEKSKIEWTDATWNPVRGCTSAGPGCDHCYARRFSERFRGVKGHPFEQGFDLRLVPEKLAEPLSWASPRMVFVNSVSDLFHESIPTDYIEQVARVMEASPWHTYQVLTKRSERMQDLLTTSLKFAARCSNIWWGVSVCERKKGLKRMQHLRKTPAKKRFISFEPLIEDVGAMNLKGIHWVIVGGESGPGARPMPKKWVKSIRAQCRKSKIPFFFKQWGGVQKKRNGRLLDGRTYDEMPAREVVEVPSREVRKELAGKLMGQTSGGDQRWIRPSTKGVSKRS